MYCQNCGTQIHSNGQFCAQCGARSAPSQTPRPVTAGRSRLAYILLAIFLGSLGVHNFYAGRISPGVGQLLLSLLLWWTIVAPIAVLVWIIVEICTVTHDGDGVPFN